MGTQKLEQVLKDTFKKAKIVRMDIDSTSQKGMHEKIIRAFQNHEYDILVGTQMIAKGLDFANVTLVGVINADSTLNVPDFRSAERSFELLSQVAGRSGRGSKKGEVIIQTFNPNHYSMQKVLKNDYQGFYEEEMKIRKEMAYPPYHNLLLISLNGRDLDNLLAEGKKITSYIKSKNLKDITILGPSAAFLPKVNNIYRVQIILKYKKLKEVYEPLKDIDDIYKNNSKINVEIDINPLRI